MPRFALRHLCVSFAAARLCANSSPAGRARKGPAPVSYAIDHYLTVLMFLQLNLEIPQYEFSDGDSKLVIG